eukprot:209570_1
MLSGMQNEVLEHIISGFKFIQDCVLHYNGHRIFHLEIRTKDSLEMKQQMQWMNAVQTMNKTGKERQELDVKHQTLQTNRMKQQTQWMNAVQTMNKTVDEENTTNEAKCRAQNEYNTKIWRGSNGTRYMQNARHY